MITAYMTSLGRIVSDELPAVGECIEVQNFGLCLVRELSHSRVDNYITLTFLECDRSMFPTGEYTETCRFEVQE